MNEYFQTFSSKRRTLLTRLLAVGGIPLIASAVPARLTMAAVNDAAAQKFMAHAVEMKRQALAAGDQPYGAVVVKGDEVVGDGPSRVVTAQDPTAHAEMEAIRDACRRLGTRNLSGCVIYATSRPCRMCETGAHWAGVSKVIYGSGTTDAGAPSYSDC